MRRGNKTAVSSKRERHAKLDRKTAHRVNNFAVTVKIERSKGNDVNQKTDCENFRFHNLDVLR